MLSHHGSALSSTLHKVIKLRPSEQIKFLLEDAAILAFKEIFLDHFKKVAVGYNESTGLLTLGLTFPDDMTCVQGSMKFLLLHMLGVKHSSENANESLKVRPLS